MTEIAELQRRLREALEQIGSGIEDLEAPQPAPVAVEAPKPAVDPFGDMDATPHPVDSTSASAEVRCKFSSFCIILSSLMKLQP